MRAKKGSQPPPVRLHYHPNKTEIQPWFVSQVDTSSMACAHSKSHGQRLVLKSSKRYATKALNLPNYVASVVSCYTTRSYAGRRRCYQGKQPFGLCQRVA